jgi:hypothetical protein
MQSEVSILLRYGAASLGYWLPTFEDKVVVSSSRVEMSGVILDGSPVVQEDIGHFKP